MMEIFFGDRNSCAVISRLCLCLLHLVRFERLYYCKTNSFFLVVHSLFTKEPCLDRR